MTFIITVSWSRRSYGPRAMVFAAWLFALSPNLLAHGALATMELPLILTITAMFHLFWQFLQTEGRILALDYGCNRRSGIFVQIHCDSDSPNPGNTLVGHTLEKKRV